MREQMFSKFILLDSLSDQIVLDLGFRAAVVMVPTDPNDGFFPNKLWCGSLKHRIICAVAKLEVRKKSNPNLGSGIPARMEIGSKISDGQFFFFEISIIIIGVLKLFSKRNTKLPLLAPGPTDTSRDRIPLKPSQIHWQQ